jgi:ribosome-binding factor A
MAQAMATKKKTDGKRSVKVGESMRAELMTMLLAGDIHDPGTADAVVSSVAVTDDLRIAKVYVRRLAPESTDAQKDALVKALYRAKGFIRRELAQRIELRYAPDLRFFWDESIDRGRGIEELLREIKRDDGDAQ